MAVQYRLYRNNGAGGPVDYSTVVNTSSTPTFNTPALALNSDNLFAVRARETTTSLEEENIDQVVRIVVDGAGNNVTARPNAPTGVSAVRKGSGGVRVAWGYSPAGEGGAPTEFRVWITAGASVNYAAAPAAVVAATGAEWYAVEVSGLTNGQAYAVGVRAANAIGVETNTTATASFVASTVGPASVQNLTGSAF